MIGWLLLNTINRRLPRETLLVGIHGQYRIITVLVQFIVIESILIIDTVLVLIIGFPLGNTRRDILRIPIPSPSPHPLAFPPIDPGIVPCGQQHIPRHRPLYIPHRVAMDIGFEHHTPLQRRRWLHPMRSTQHPAISKDLDDSNKAIRTSNGNQMVFPRQMSTPRNSANIKGRRPFRCRNGQSRFAVPINPSPLRLHCTHSLCPLHCRFQPDGADICVLWRFIIKFVDKHPVPIGTHCECRQFPLRRIPRHTKRLQCT